MAELAHRARLMWLLLLGQSLGSAAFITGGTVGALVGEQLSGQTALAGLPGAVYLLGSALTAYPAARLMQHLGRRPGLLIGFSLGIIGALIAGLSVVYHTFIGFVLGFGLMGATRGFTDLARYAAAEMHPAAERARAISLVVWGGTIGAVTGPALVGPTGKWATALGVDPLAGPWFASLGLFAVGLMLITLFLQPDPSVIAQAVAAAEAPENTAISNAPPRAWRLIFAQPSARAALAAMVVGQLVMVMVMVVTSLHMKHHGHALDDVSFVIMAHTLGMFGLSVVSGRLADNFGRANTIVLGGAILIAACLLAPLSQATPILAAALFLLGLGWNLCYVAGAALLTDSLTLSERSQVQGSSDLAVGLISALGNLQSAALLSIIGYDKLAWISLVFTLLPLILAWRLRGARPLVTASS
jgi:MFS family permease